MIKIVAAGAGAALLLGSVTLLPGMAPMVNAGTAMQQRVVVISNAKAKADRLDIRQLWPGLLRTRLALLRDKLHPQRGQCAGEADPGRQTRPSPGRNQFRHRPLTAASATDFTERADRTSRAPALWPASPFKVLRRCAAQTLRKIGNCDRNKCRSSGLRKLDISRYEPTTTSLPPERATNSLRPASSFPVTLMQPTVITR